MSIFGVSSTNFTIGILSYFDGSFGASINSQSKKLINSYLLITCGVIFLIWYAQLVWKRRYLYIHSWKVPGPFSLPIIGSAHLFLSTETSVIMRNLLNLQNDYPDIAVFWLGPKLVFAVSNPKHIEKILTSSKALDKDDLYRFITFVTGEGLVSARAQHWKKHRRVIRPAFNQKILNSYQEVFLRHGEVFAHQLQKNVGNKELDLFDLISKCTLDIICETAMGLNMHIQTSSSEVCKNLDRIMEVTTYRIFRVWHHLDFTWYLYPISKKYDRMIKTFKDFTGAVIKKKMEAYNIKQSSNPSITTYTEQDTSERLSFFDLILENSNFTEQELHDEVNLFLIAGTDTTASALSCIFTMLGMFQDVQQKVLQEILEIVGPDRRVLPSDLPNMKYTERVIKESLRLFPVAAFFVRKISDDIDAGDMIFPAGSSAYFGCVHIHRNPKYWSDPLKFDPDRFLPENVEKRHPCTYIPFSYGPRNCIGGQYAMINMKTILTTILRRFKIFTHYKTIEEIELKVNVVLRMKHGPKVWVEAR